MRQAMQLSLTDLLAAALFMFIFIITQECYAMASASYEGQPAALEHTMQSGTAGNAPLQIGYDGQVRPGTASSSSIMHNIT